LVIAEPTLAELPWEYTYLSLLGRNDPHDFLVRYPTVSVVRDEPLPLPHGSISPREPGHLRLVAATANSPGYLQLDLDKEGHLIQTALDDIPAIDYKPILVDPTEADLQKALIGGVDMFHFAGHGGVQDGEGFVALPSEERTEAAILEADTLAGFLQSAGVRLAIVGACESGRRDALSRWTGVVPALAAGVPGIPAVVAMQYRISDPAAIKFSRAFYTSIAAGLSVDEAVLQGRLALFDVDDPSAPWGLPVLYLRSPDGVIFPHLAKRHSRTAGALREAVNERTQIVDGVVMGVDAADRSLEATAGRHVVGIRPVGSLEHWRDREALREELKRLLKDGTRIISVIGRRGVGKSGVVTRVLADFEEQPAGETGGIDGIVYLGMRTGSADMTLASIFHSIVELLPDSEQIRLSGRWKRLPPESALGELFDSLRARRVVVVLDNLDDLQEPKTGAFRRSDVPDFLHAVAMAPRSPQVLTTSQQGLVLPVGVEEYVTECELDEGLSPELGASLLRELDARDSAGLQELDDADLRALSDRVGGIPLGLQLLVAYLSRHRTSGVHRLLNSTLAPEEVLKELVSTTYKGLAGTAREVMDVIAVAGVPLSPEAFTALCENQPPDQVEDALDDLINRCALILDDDHRLVRLHPLDTDYVLSILEHDRLVALDLRLAQWYARRATDRSAWRRLTDADPVKQEYRHLWRAGHRAEALDVLAGAAEFLGRHGGSSFLWSAVADSDKAGLEATASREVCLGFAEVFSGSLEVAAECFRRASQLASGVAEWDLWSGIALRETGRGREAAEVLSPLASDRQNPREIRIQAAFELGISWCYAGSLAEAEAAVRQLEALIKPDDPALAHAYVANVCALLHLIAGRLPESVTAAEEGIAAYEDSPESDAAGYVRNTRGLALLLMGRVADAAADFSAVATDAATLGYDRLEGIALANLGWAELYLGARDAAAAAAQKAIARLTSSSANAAAPQALLEVLGASAEKDIEQLLERCAATSDANPDFYRPPSGAISELTSALARRDGDQPPAAR
jgi:tetratricopeptide (TPR) repeat protein